MKRRHVASRSARRAPKSICAFFSMFLPKGLELHDVRLIKASLPHHGRASHHVPGGNPDVDVVRADGLANERFLGRQVTVVLRDVRRRCRDAARAAPIKPTRGVLARHAVVALSRGVLDRGEQKS